MLSKSQISFIRSLHQKKFRKENKLFIAEGFKTVKEFIDSGYTVDTIFYTAHVSPKLLNLSQKIKLQEITVAELVKISTLSAPQDVLALIAIPVETTINPESFSGTYTLVLDGIQDPGNLGTIIRTADWFGFKQIICSPDTVEAYNPKVVQATMGSLARISVVYADLDIFLKQADVPIYGAVLGGVSVYDSGFGNEGLIVLGNEGNGISNKVLKLLTHQITIPAFGDTESLNVSVAAGIICYELRRRLKA